MIYSNEIQDELYKQAKQVMNMLEEYGGSIVPHLIDTDDNAGEFLRQAIANAEKEDTEWNNIAQY